MNRYIETANFDIEKFPLDCGTLRGMQDNTAILAVLARIAAGKDTDRLILCGCEDMRNGYRGEGYIWKASEERPLTGEIIYHAEQRLNVNFVINEETESVNVDGTDYLNLYRHRVANDTSIGGEAWSGYTRLDEVSNVALRALMDAEAKARADADTRLERLIGEEAVERNSMDVDLKEKIVAESVARGKRDAEIELRLANLTIPTLPSGLICMWSGTTPPEGWALCDGKDGRPDLRGRFVLGYNASVYTTSTGESISRNSIGNTGGQENVRLTEGQMPAHSHNFVGDDSLIEWHTPVNTASLPLDILSRETSGCRWYKTGSSGQGQAHNNMPPYYVLAYIIKL